MPLAPRIFKRLSELLDVTGQTGFVYVTGGTATFISTTGSGDVVLAGSPQFTGTAQFADALVNGVLDVIGGITATTVASAFTGDGSGLTNLGGSSISTGTIAAARGGTGVSNTGTITNASDTTITGGGTLALGGFTFTVPSTGTAVTTTTINNATLPASFTTGAFSGILNSTNTTSATTSLLGAVVIGNGTAATSVGIGGGRLEVGTSLKAPYFAASTAQFTQNGTGIAHITQFGSTTNLNALQLGGTTKGLRLVMASDGNVTLTDSAGTASTGNLTVNNSIVGGTLAVTGAITGASVKVGGSTVSNGIIGSLGSGNNYIEAKTSATGAGLSAGFTAANSASNGTFFKCSTSYGTYKTLGNSDLGFYNAATGNISVLNDNAAGNINFAAGGSSAAHLTIASTGAVTLASTLAVTDTVTEGGSAAGAVTTQTRLVKAVSTIADNTATTVLTITIPNAAHSASVRVRLVGAAGLGGAINLAREATATIAYDIAVTRTAGSLAVATISTAFGSASASVAGGSVLTVAGTITHGGEGTGVANTYLVKVTIDDTTGSATNHTCQVVAECANAAATGITIA